MLNLNEEDLKAAIVERATDELMNNDRDISSLLASEIKARLDKIFAESAKVQIETAINDAIAHSFDREYCRITAWGEAEGQPTTIRAELLKTVNGYWGSRVNARNGAPSESSYDSVSRAEYVMTQVCAKDFTEKMRESAISVAGALKDGFRAQMGKHMDELLESLYRVKSLQDQGKVEKPW